MWEVDAIWVYMAWQSDYCSDFIVIILYSDLIISELLMFDSPIFE